MSKIHHIVIVGGGVGGLELVTQLGDTLGKAQKAKITLIDQKLTHIWKPLLHEIAAGTMNPNDEETNYYAHAAKHHYEFIQGRFEHLDRENKQITLSKPQTSKYEAASEKQTVAYDTLVLALGSVSNDFNTPGVKEYCHYLDSPKQAEIFQQDLLHLYLDAQNTNTERSLNIAVIGAGATGVELSAELVEAKQNFYNYGLNKINPNQVKISLIEGANRILPALSEKMAEHAEKQLQRMKIDVLTSKRVEKVDAEKVYFNDGTSIQAELKVWAAGIKTPKVIADLPDFKKDRMGRLEVYATLQTKTDPSIFAIGDCANCILDAREAPLGPRAQVASQQATFMVDALKARINGNKQPMFQFSEKGSLVSLSKNKAVGELLGQVNVQGFVAKSMYVSLYRLHQATIYGYAHAGLLTAKDFVTRKIAPRIKLH
ncbi:NAD(P)/FAD-dependent oxidoreductase [Acinetobacter sp. CFCC 10889]|uniref:NAD(P)/FAD-dependent oxidoreductase n=1 Tax=Acinetobacter sp. CFCC 10889 TaxID=1775557 RepID=UPI000DCF991A|nr:NAD(P)/FAD-dependent oxidoreductase [Acinetobacter sp. CFCC 10889]